jgi:hypothetical protein
MWVACQLSCFSHEAISGLDGSGSSGALAIGLPQLAGNLSGLMKHEQGDDLLLSVF